MFNYEPYCVFKRKNEQSYQNIYISCTKFQPVQQPSFASKIPFNFKTNFKSMKKSYLMLLLCSSFFYGTTSLHALNPSKSPLMGWASWNNFGVNISESIIKGQADAMVLSGLSDAGYTYLNIDDGFFNGRYSNGALRIDSIKFKNGMKYLADYIHSQGLKAGFYSEAGANTCGSMGNGQTGGIGAGLYNHEKQDIDSIFIKWGYDYLKVDYCGGMALKLDEQSRYTAIRSAIDNTGKPDISYNICRWQFPGTWATKLANSWRISGDINLNWNTVTGIIDLNTFLSAYISPGHYNDMDMLEVGRGLTAEEDKSHFSMWCIMSSPLVLGNNMATLSTTAKNILTNTEVIAVNQDTTGLQGILVSDNRNGLQVWAKNLNGKQSKEKAVVLFNRSASSASMSIKWKDLNLVGKASVRDLWKHTDLGDLDSMYTATVPSHGVVVLKVVGTESKLQEVYEAENAWVNNFNLTINSSIMPNQGSAVFDGACSGRGKVGWIGSRADNYLEFRDIYTTVEGDYNLSLTYSSGENRSATMTVNGTDILLTNLNSGSYTTFKTSSYAVHLKKGYNIIRFSNSSTWMPDIDKIQLDLNKYDATAVTKLTLNQSITIHPNPCSEFIQIDSEQPIKQIEIFSLAGSLLKTYIDSKISVSELESGTYILKITTTSQEVYTQKIIKV